MPDQTEPQIRVVDRRWWAQDKSAGTAEAPSSTKPTYIEELEKRLADATTQLQSYIAEHRRSLDEFEQVKVRIRRDVAREVERGRRAVLVELLEVLDNVDRAIGAARDADAPAGREAADRLARGIEMIRDQFLAKLEAFGVTRVPAIGQRFDATRHEAVTTLATADPALVDTVVAVIKEGYAIGDEVLRPAGVVVGRHTDG